MQLGLVTYRWAEDWDLPTVIENCQATGFGGVELRSTHKHGVEITLNKEQRREVADRFADAGIELVGLGSACEYHAADPQVLQKNIDETKQFIELCHDVGGTGVKVRPNGLPANVSEEKTLEQIGRALNHVGEFGAGYGIEIRLEVHGRGTQELPRMKRIMDVATHENVGVCWNCNPTDLAGDGLQHNFGLVKDRLGQTVHIHDLISDYPWAEFFQLLAAENYQGWTLLEEGNVTPDPVRVMKYYRQLWERMTAEAAAAVG